MYEIYLVILYTQCFRYGILFYEKIVQKQDLKKDSLEIELNKNRKMIELEKIIELNQNISDIKLKQQQNIIQLEQSRNRIRLRTEITLLQNSIRIETDFN